MGVGVQKDPSPARRPIPARWDPGGLREHMVVVGPDGREFGEAGYGLQGGHQDLRAKKGLVRDCGFPGHLAPGSPGTHQCPAPAGGCGTQAQLLAVSADWWTPSVPAAPPSKHRSSG